MGIIVPSSYALSAEGVAHGWKPVIGWHNLATTSTLTTTYENASYPATNLANPRTNSVWKSGSLLAQKITVLFGAEYDVDYAALARHNLGTGACPTSIQGLAAGGDPDIDGDWTELVASQVLADNSPAMFRFTKQGLIGVRYALTPVATQPQAAVVHVGELLVLDKGLPEGHIPITYGRNVTKASPISQGGDMLGRIVQTASLSSSIVQEDLDPDWYRENLEPFRAACDEDYFFFAWSPQSYPAEVGYCEVTNDPKPVINRKTGHISISFEIAGLAV